MASSCSPPRGCRTRVPKWSLSGLVVGEGSFAERPGSRAAGDAIRFVGAARLVCAPAPAW